MNKNQNVQSWKLCRIICIFKFSSFSRFRKVYSWPCLEILPYSYLISEKLIKSRWSSPFFPHRAFPPLFPPTTLSPRSPLLPAGCLPAPGERVREYLRGGCWEVKEKRGQSVPHTSLRHYLKVVNCNELWLCYPGNVLSIGKLWLCSRMEGPMRKWRAQK